MERLHGIINGLKAKKTKNKQKCILKNHVLVDGKSGYIVKINPKFVYAVLAVGIFTVTPIIRKYKNEIPTHLRPFVGSTTYKVINWSGYHRGI